jgi:Polyketide cyclase / dehydrase and lipid transport
MTFDYERTVTTTATPAQVWSIWSDVGSWHCWDPAVQQVALEGHFAEGAAGTMVLTSGVQAPFVLEIVEPCARYLDRLTMGDLVIRIDHTVRAVEAGSEITVRTTIEGPGAEDIGPKIIDGTPRSLEALAEMAEQQQLAPRASNRS